MTYHHWPMIIRGIYRALAALFLCLSVIACSHQPPPAPSPLPLMDEASLCLRDLALAGADFQPVEDIQGPGRCGVTNAVSVSGGLTAWNRPATMTCNLARMVVSFEQTSNELALKHFGQPLRKIHHMGTYACRARNNSATQVARSQGREGRLSEHGLGNAIDIMAYELADGTIINVRRDWFKGGKKAAFLRDVARQACKVFNVVLSPNHDKFHHDHLHFDMGPWTSCGI